MSVHDSVRKFIHSHPIQILFGSLLLLLAIQLLTSESVYGKFSVFMVFVVFAFKSWVNIVFSITTRRQNGETALSLAIEKYFLALLFQSSIFSLSFLIAFLDLMGVHVWGMEWVPFRNTLRTVAIISVMSVIIYGDQTLDALMDDIKSTVKVRARQDERGRLQDARDGDQDQRDLDWKAAAMNNQGDR